MDGQAIYGYIYRHTYLEVKRAQAEARANCGRPKLIEKHFLHPATLEEHLNVWLQSIRFSVKKSTYANYNGLSVAILYRPLEKSRFARWTAN
jgi:hypothetical protein